MSREERRGAAGARPRKAGLARTSAPRQRVGASVPAANECVPHVMQIYRLPSTSFYYSEHRPGRFASTIVDSIYHLPRSTPIYRVEGRATTPQRKGYALKGTILDQFVGSGRFRAFLTHH